MTIEETKKEYNKLLIRYSKAAAYFDNPSISQEDKERFLPDFQEVLKGLSYCLSKIEVYTNQEVLEGFKGEFI